MSSLLIEEFGMGFSKCKMLTLSKVHLNNKLNQVEYLGFWLHVMAVCCKRYLRLARSLIGCVKFDFVNLMEV